MKFLVLFAPILALTVLPLRAEDAWLTDHPRALEKARADKKPLLIDFTGSDWCGWCIKLDKEVFSTPQFKSYAEKNLVLLKADFPRHASLPAALQQQNMALATKYKIEGYPTIVVLDPDGKRLGDLGYGEGGPGPWIAELEKLTKKR